MIKHKYRRITTIEYNNKFFEVFRDERGRYAFLKNSNNKLIYPTINELAGLIKIFSNRPKGIAFFDKKRNDKIKKKMKMYQFTASAVALGGVIACTSILYNELANRHGLDANEVANTISVSDDYDPKIDNSNDSYSIEDYDDYSYDNEDTNDYTDFSLVDLSNGYQIPTYVEPSDRTVKSNYYEKYSEHEVLIYNHIALDEYLGYKTVSLDQINDAIEENSKIPYNYKSVIKDFAKDMMTTYPGIDMRVFYENVKKMQIIDRDKARNKSDAEAWFDYSFDVIYVANDLDLSPGSQGLKIFRHELGHSINLGMIYHGDKVLILTMQKENYGFYIQEGCNVIVTSYPFENEYEDENLGYPLISNELRLIYEATPGYDPRNLVFYNIDFLEKFLDENNRNTDISANELFDIMEMQTTDYYNPNIKGNTNDYAKIYKYIADVYINNVFNDSMSEEDIETYRQYIKYNLSKCLTDLDTVRLDVIDDAIDNYLSNRVSYTKH